MKKLISIIFLLSLILTVSCTKESVTPEKKMVVVDIYGVSVNTPENVDLTIITDLNGNIESNDVSSVIPVRSFENTYLGLTLLYSKAYYMYVGESINVKTDHNILNNSSIQVRVHYDGSDNSGSLIINNGTDQFKVITSDGFKPVQVFRY